MAQPAPEHEFDIGTSSRRAAVSEQLPNIACTRRRRESWSAAGDALSLVRPLIEESKTRKAP